jgi:hypothetical protein
MRRFVMADDECMGPQQACGPLLDEAGHMIVCEPFAQPLLFAPAARLNVRAAPSVTATRVGILGSTTPVMVYGHYSDPHRDEFWVAVDASLTRWVVQRRDGKEYGAVIGRDPARKE